MSLLPLLSIAFKMFLLCLLLVSLPSFKNCLFLALGLFKFSFYVSISLPLLFSNFSLDSLITDALKIFCQHLSPLLSLFLIISCLSLVPSLFRFSFYIFWVRHHYFLIFFLISTIPVTFQIFCLSSFPQKPVLASFMPQSSYHPLCHLACFHFVPGLSGLPPRVPESSLVSLAHSGSLSPCCNAYRWFQG